VAELEGKWTPHLVLLAEGAVEERRAIISNVRRLLIAIEEAVHAGVRVDADREPKLLLQSCEVQRGGQGILDVSGAPAGAECDAAGVELAEEALGLRIVFGRQPFEAHRPYR